MVNDLAGTAVRHTAAAVPAFCFVVYVILSLYTGLHTDLIKHLFGFV